MTTAFQPTHYLVSRSRKVPVRVVSGNLRSQVFTEQEWLESRDPAFELHAKLGLYCRGVQIVGYHLEPVAVPAPTPSPVA
ncbi:MAG: hypothetical protein ICV62_13305 [Cyanobacteria bacterium Co-bin13]|nr:hypothetical protein [Cyanobacteria bacterium Co-bin13]